MAHYAFVNDENTVVEVIVGRNENESVDGITDWESYYSSRRTGLRALRTSYNTRGGIHYDPATGLPSESQLKSFRHNYASIGAKYVEELDGFSPARPYPSWRLVGLIWTPPVPPPDKSEDWWWDEGSLSWATEEPISEQGDY